MQKPQLWMENPQLSILTLIALFFASFFLWNVLCLLKNIYTARKIGLPYTIYPFQGTNGWAEALFATKPARAIVDRLPTVMADYINTSGKTRRWKVKHREPERAKSGLFLHVSPAGVLLCVAEAGVAQEVLIDHERFGKRMSFYEPFRMYGSNIVASDGHEWQHFRKHVWPVFNERVNNAVWHHSILQGSELLQKWTNQATSPGKELNAATPEEDFMSLALNVFAGAALGIRMSICPTPSSSGKVVAAEDDDDEDPFAANAVMPTGFTLPFTETLRIISYNMLIHLTTVAMLPRWIPTSILPGWMRMHKAANSDLTRYLAMLVARAQNMCQTKSRENLLSMLAAGQRDGENDKDTGLTSSEVAGNLFILNFAGHETTASSLNFAFILMAMYPEMQQWVQKNIDEVLSDQPEDPTLWRYEEVFPKLTAPLCLMIETLRVYSIIPGIPRTIHHSTTITSANGQTYMIPAGTNVEVLSCVLQVSPEYWGEDVDKFDPRRWDRHGNPHSFLARNEGMPGLGIAGLESSCLHRPVRGAFTVFSDGPRGCIGRRFSIVEFVTVIARVLAAHTVELALLPGELEVDAKKRAETALDRSYAKLTLGAGGKVPLVLRRRKLETGFKAI